MAEDKFKKLLHAVHQFEDALDDYKHSPDRASGRILIETCRTKVSREMDILILMELK